MSSSALIVGGASLAGSFVMSVILTPMIRRWALQRGFVDRPMGAGSHKQHKQPVAFGGGIAITIAAVLPMALVLLMTLILHRIPGAHLAWISRVLPSWPAGLGGVVQKAPQALAVIAGALVMHLLGIIDDHRPLSPMLKLAVQVAVALMLTGSFGIRSATVLGPFTSILLSTLWIVALTNAFNFMDNMDGLAAGVAALTATLLSLSAFMTGQVFIPSALLLLAGAVLGFLVYNFPPASIFMGDAGSLVVGYMLSVCTILVTFNDPALQRQPIGVIVPLLVFAVPLYDMTSVIVHRSRLHVSIFRSDRRHFSHRLVKLGLSPKAAVLTIYLATAATALPAVVVPTLTWTGACLIFAQCICVVAIIAILESRDGT
jgi:UDP-GlcNAc:undecaprenyl-phosphate/decaprenyl-phosphate GlcNAc-1-phosphate transferase